MEMTVKTIFVGLADYNTVICNGEVTISEDFNIAKKGVLWSKYPFSTLQNCDGSINIGEGEGSFTVNIENLDYETTYFINECSLKRPNRFGLLNIYYSNKLIYC